MNLRPYKFLVVAVVQQVDDDGNVTGELQPEKPDVVFAVEGLRAYADGFEGALSRHAAAIANGAPTGDAVVPIPIPESRRAPR